MSEKGYMRKAVEYGPRAGIEKVLEVGTNYYMEKILDVMNEGKSKDDQALVYMAMQNGMQQLDRNLTQEERDMVKLLRETSVVISNA